MIEEQNFVLKRNEFLNDSNAFVKAAKDNYSFVGDSNKFYIDYTDDEGNGCIQGVAGNGLVFIREVLLPADESTDELHTMEIWLSDYERKTYNCCGNDHLRVEFDFDSSRAVEFYNEHCEDGRDTLIRFIIRHNLLINAITSFKGKHSFLSNFHQHPFDYKGLVYPNAESAFQAQKCSTDDERIKYTTQKNPVRAKQMGRKEPNLPQNWNLISYDIMFDILRAKFAVPELADKLMGTGTRYIEEGNRWHDNYWGNCTCEKCEKVTGQNQLGEILMRIRKDLQDRKLLGEGFAEWKVRKEQHENP